ncbi:succinate dehydrogenase assembly factor 2 [Tabrizicola sp. DMG-N-6]|uniref:FAD assembly factor SdhE n=2 Tax=Szabonella alba TaxID=2804194 RepID=A0A8K0V9B2_9RHOB|nr:succinate dehydrogenase assembly factor 2 [Szabonella alba]
MLPERPAEDRAEDPGARLKRLAMRAGRRGMKEMDIVLGPWAQAHLGSMAAAELDLFDRLLWENDQDLLAWVLGQAAPPADYAGLIGRIAGDARDRLRPGALRPDGPGRR